MFIDFPQLHIIQDPRNRKQLENVKYEIGIMKEVEDHPNAVKLFEAYNDATAFYLVMQCCDGGELFEHIPKEKVGT